MCTVYDIYRGHLLCPRDPQKRQEKKASKAAEFIDIPLVAQNVSLFLRLRVAFARAPIIFLSFCRLCWLVNSKLPFAQGCLFFSSGTIAESWCQFVTLP